MRKRQRMVYVPSGMKQIVIQPPVRPASLFDKPCQTKPNLVKR